ncbi:hypothetical protein [Methanobrevibacter sp.]|uniref:hypothetical protein n=1 Tax=Methanobrevibacter sp. TaxID=66852 RepID=UPI00388F6D15
MKEIKFDKKEIDLLIYILENYPTNNDIIKLRKKLKNASRQIKPSSAKAKGRNLQYLVCQKIAEKMGVEYNQSDDNCPIHSREMGQHGTDIILRGKIKELLPLDIECKNQETMSLMQWIEQAKNNSSTGNWSVVVKNKKLNNPIICLDFDTFLNFIL